MTTSRVGKSWKKVENEMGVKIGEPEKNYYLNQKDTSISRTSEKKMVCFPEKNDLDETWVRQ